MVQKRGLGIYLVFLLILFSVGIFAIDGDSSSYTLRTDIGYGGAETNASSTSYTTRFISGNAPSSEEDSTNYYGRGGILGRIFNLATCGNNIKEVGETCDGTALNSQTCVDQGFDSGDLDCSSDCGSFVTSGCSTDAVVQDSSGGGGGGVTTIPEEHECEEDSDCEENKYCFEYECYESECSSNSDCPSDETCYSGRCAKLFDAEILEIISPEVTGEPFRFNYLIKGMAEFNNDVVVKYWIENNEGEISSGQDTFYLGSFETVEKESELYLPREFTSGVYTFNVAVTYGNYQAKSSRTIQIDSEQQVISYSPVPSNWKTYVFPVVFVLGLILISLVIYIERKKLRKILAAEERLFRKYKWSISIVVIIFLTWLTLHILKAVGIISVPWMYDYYVLGKYLLGNVLYLIAGIMGLILVILSIILVNKKYKERKKGMPYLPKRYSKKIAPRKIVQKKSPKKNKKQKLISRWEKKGYDTNIFTKKKKISKKDIIADLKKWKKKGYDTDSIS